MATTATPSAATATSSALGDSGRAKAFHWITSGVTVLGLVAILETHHPREDAAEIAAWVLACLLADLMYVRIGRSITLSMSLPVVLAAALLHAPAVAALIAFLGSLDPREIRGQSSVERILFNRSQVALSAAAASVAYPCGRAGGLGLAPCPRSLRGGLDSGQRGQCRLSGDLNRSLRPRRMERSDRGSVGS